MSRARRRVARRGVAALCGVALAFTLSGCEDLDTGSGKADKSGRPARTEHGQRAVDGRGGAPRAKGREQRRHPARPVPPGQQVRTTLVRAIGDLEVAPERRSGYDRDLFVHWVDADGNGCDTREEVLVSQNRAPGARLGRYCEVLAGEWFSYYDQVTTTHAGDFDVDHLVPLAEAWDSGAWAWTPARREAFANDLGDRRALVAVSATANRTKSDADPAGWMPAYKSCVYVSSWVAIKTRWQLSVDPAERAALERYADACGPRRTTVRVAEVVGATTRDARPSDAARMPRSTAPVPQPAPQPTAPGGSPGGSSGAGGTDPRFDYCTTAIAAGYGPYVRGRDPEYGWYRDADGDGTVCER